LTDFKPTDKAPEIDRILTEITGKVRRKVIGEGCMTCDYPDLAFRDELSKREYTISGMCQRCQDEVFGP
jgi:hypothetical protein